ncbi:MAG: urease accessory protein UreE [Pseudomonadota bacterium]
MLRLIEVIDTPEGQAAAPRPALTLTLSFEDRRRSRLRARLVDGDEVALFLPRGSRLRDGAWLRAEGGGPTVLVRATAETLSVAATPDPHLLARAAYHLGNRHVPLQVGQGWVAYQHDHVLDDLARALGLALTTKTAPFEPEGGGYEHDAHHHHGAHHHDGHDHGHDHGNDHDHDR